MGLLSKERIFFIEKTPITEKRQKIILKNTLLLLKMYPLCPPTKGGFGILNLVWTLLTSVSKFLVCTLSGKPVFGPASSAQLAARPTDD